MNTKERTPRKVDPQWAAPCGICCRLCDFYHSPVGLSCGGCHSERLCRVTEERCCFVICAEEHDVEHCGLCEEFPCARLYQSHQACAGDDPRVAVFRIGDLALRTRMGTLEWLRAKMGEELPDVWDSRFRPGTVPRKERRRHRRSAGNWNVTVSFYPAPQAFGLSGIETVCKNAGPEGMMLCLPENARNGFTALARTGRIIEVAGEFPTSRGRTPFTGRVAWHNLDDRSSEDSIKVGIALTAEP